MCDAMTTALRTSANCSLCLSILDHIWPHWNVVWISWGRVSMQTINLASFTSKYALISSIRPPYMFTRTHRRTHKVEWDKTLMWGHYALPYVAIRFDNKNFEIARRSSSFCYHVHLVQYVCSRSKIRSKFFSDKISVLRTTMIVYILIMLEK